MTFDEIPRVITRKLAHRLKKSSAITLGLSLHDVTMMKGPHTGTVNPHYVHVSCRITVTVHRITKPPQKMRNMLLPAANEVWGKVFTHVCQAVQMGGGGVSV